LTYKQGHKKEKKQEKNEMKKKEHQSLTVFCWLLTLSSSPQKAARPAAHFQQLRNWRVLL
jgi:hypothetical protein